jgi:hypothetical protein
LAHSLRLQHPAGTANHRNAANQERRRSVPHAEEAAEQSRAAFDPVDTRATEGLLQVPELTVSSDERRIVDGQKEAFTKGRFEDISFAYACAIEWRHSALPQAQLSLCGRKC